MAKEHKKSESYQLTRSLRSAVLSHSSSCSYVTCRSGFQFTFAREPLLLLLPPTMLIAAWSCVRAHWENSPTHTGTEEDGTFFRSPAARRLLRRVLWRFRPVVSFLTLYVWSDVRLGLLDELLQLLRQFLCRLSRMVNSQDIRCIQLC